MPIELKEKYPFSVDTWTTLAKRKRHHFLTHAHSDHTAGIESFAARFIYCSDLTRRLVLRRFPKLCASQFIILEVDESRLVHDDEQPFTVTALDANHCPGAVMLLFEGDFGNVLHTGDCRFTEDCLKNVLGKYRAQKTVLNCVYLDCTFGKEHLKMPSKNEASLQVRQCILDHPQAPVVYLASDLLGHEELLSDLAAYFKTKIYVDKRALPEFYADLMIVAPELVTEEPESTRFHICEGSPKLYDRVKIKFMQARTKRLPEPLFIRPSAQYYTFEERLEGAGCGMILDVALKRSASQRRHLRVPKAAERDEHGIWHVCYSIHSCRSELERAMEILWPKEVISTTDCHASEVMSKRVGLHHVDVSFAASVRVLKTHQEEPCNRIHPIEKHNIKVRSKVLGSPTNPRAKKRACLEKEPHRDHHADDLSMVVPLFGMARHSIPTSPPLSFTSTDSLENQELEDSQCSVECLPDGCERGPVESQEVCPSGTCEALSDSKNFGVSVSPQATPKRIDDAAEILSRQDTNSSKVTVQAECAESELDEFCDKENVASSIAVSENIPVSPRSSDHKRGVISLKEATRKLYRSFAINASDDQVAATLQGKILDAVQMKSVTGDSRPNCLIIDEIDGVLGGTEGRSAIKQLVDIVTATSKKNRGSEEYQAQEGLAKGVTKKSKSAAIQSLTRPIICICNDLYAPALRPLRQIARVHMFSRPNTSRVVARLKYICDEEKFKTNIRALTTLAEHAESDIRACLNTLQFLKRKGQPLTSVSPEEKLRLLGYVSRGQHEGIRFSIAMVCVGSQIFGSKDMTRSVFDIWGEIFQKIDMSSKLQARQPKTGLVNLTQDQLQFHHIYDLIDNYGEHELAIDGIHENLVHAGYQDFFFKNWYQSSTLITIRSLIAVPVRPKIERPKAYQRYKTGVAGKREMMNTWINQMSPSIARSISISPITLDVLSPLLALLSPPLRPVAVQLYTNSEKETMKQLVDTMVGYGLTYEHSKWEELQADALESNMQIVHERNQSILKEEIEKHMCAICLRSPKDPLCFPCIHAGFCFRCLEKHREKSRTCPTCRATLYDVLRIDICI